MSTTDLFVELLVIGTGAVFWLAILFFTAFGYNWVPLDFTISLLALVPFLSVTYVLGIITDRLADILFSRWDKPLRTSIFPDNTEYHNARAYVYTYATDRIINLFEYGKSRLRISRAWSINFALLAASSIVFIWTRFPQLTIGFRLVITVACFVIFGSGTIVTWYIWRKLTENDLERLAGTYFLLRRERQSDDKPPNTT